MLISLPSTWSIGYEYTNGKLEKISVRPRKNMAEGDEKHVMLLMGEFRRVLAKSQIVMRAAGIEPAPLAWEARVLPLNYARVLLSFHKAYHEVCRDRKR